MGNKLSHCTGCSTNAGHRTECTQKTVKIGVMREDDIILKVDSGPRELHNTFMNKPFWRESIQSVVEPTVDEYKRVSHL